MPPLVTKPLVMTDVIYSLDYVTIKKIILFNSLKKNEAQLEFKLKVMERAKVACYWGISEEKQFNWYFFVFFRGAIPTLSHNM